MPKNKKITVGVIFGGKSGEHEVSIASALSIIKNINKKKYKILPIGIHKNGNWSIGSLSYKLVPENMKKFLPSKEKDLQKKHFSLPSFVLQKPYIHLNTVDVVFPALHGTYGEDGTIQGMLELANIPYVGSGVLGSALGMDKVVQKELYKLHGLKQSNYFYFFKKDWSGNKKQILRFIEKNYKYPIFVKPANLGSSVGISKAKNKKGLVQAINSAGQYDNKILIEEGLQNIREIECAVLGNYNPKVSVCGEVIPSNEFYDYNAKYTDNASKICIPAQLDKRTEEKIQSMALRAFTILNLSGMARVDFFLTKKNVIYINEVNTIPGFTSISMYPKLWEASGLPYEKLIDKLIVLALERHKEKNSLKTSFRPQTARKQK